MVTGLKEGYRKTMLSMTMKGQRIASIDLAKGFCISIVMCFHIKDIIPDDCMLAPVAFSACMLPPFYFLSGLCFKEEASFGMFIQKKVDKNLAHTIPPCISVAIFWTCMACSYFAIVPFCKKFLPHVTAQRPILYRQANLGAGS